MNFFREGEKKIEIEEEEKEEKEKKVGRWCRELLISTTGIESLYFRRRMQNKIRIFKIDGHHYIRFFSKKNALV